MIQLLIYAHRCYSKALSMQTHLEARGTRLSLLSSFSSRTLKVMITVTLQFIKIVQFHVWLTVKMVGKFCKTFHFLVNIIKIKYLSYTKCSLVQKGLFSLLKHNLQKKLKVCKSVMVWRDVQTIWSRTFFSRQSYDRSSLGNGDNKDCF